jgi:hypothetical protein
MTEAPEMILVEESKVIFKIEAIITDVSEMLNLYNTVCCKIIPGTMGVG